MHRCLARVLLFLACLAATRLACADAIDRIAVEELQRQRSPALALAVVRNGRPVKVQGYGLANLELHAPASATTVFQTASVGKQFTAALVMLLARDGRLSLDDPVARHLPDAPPAWQPITIRQLLTHTAGVAEDDTTLDLRRDYTEAERLASAFQVPLRSTPGTTHAYSNLGYQVLGILCSRVGGRFWGDQLRERVLAPLGMDTRVISERELVPGRAAGYERVDRRWFNQAWVAPSQNTTADGSLYVTARDMARWAQALDGPQLLTPEEKAAWWTPAPLAGGGTAAYGFGWELAGRPGHRQVFHRGYWQGFTTFILHLPEDRVTVSVLMNRAGAFPQRVAERIAAQLLPALRRAAPSPARWAAVPLFLRGDMNGWDTSTPFTVLSPGRLQARVQLPAGTTRFKIGGADWAAVELGAMAPEANVLPGRPQRLRWQGDDFWLDAGHAGEHMIELDLRGRGAPTLTVTAQR